MKDVFNNEQSYKHTRFEKFSDMLLTVSGGDVSSQNLLQAISINYGTQIPIVREIGSKKYYYGQQPGQGSMQVQRYISDKSIYQVLPQAIFTALNVEGQKPPDIILSSLDGHIKYTLHNCIVTSYGATAQDGATYVQESVVIQFMGLTENGA